MIEEFMQSVTYQIGKDLGSLIGGGLALWAGFLAYRGAMRQARETRDAAVKQIEVMEATAAAAAKAAEEGDRRQRVGLLRALQLETSRIKILATDRAMLVEAVSANSSFGPNESTLQAYMIYTLGVLRDGGGAGYLMTTSCWWRRWV